jgi:hypothetical protein
MNGGFLALLATFAAPAAASEAPICTDRPAKANAVCTVPSGRVQLEVSALGWARSNAGAVVVQTITAGASALKVGLTGRSDLELFVTPFVTVRQAGARAISGIGDATVRYKHRLSASDAPVQLGLLPFVKLPTARRGIGNRRVEGGLALPVSFALAGSVTATFGPEVDLLADGDGHGVHPALIQLVNLSVPATPRLALIGELWASRNRDPAGAIRQASADAAVAYALTSALQIDAGINFGLTKATPGVELYAGISKRF